MKNYRIILFTGCLISIVCIALCSSSAISACKTGHYRADFNNLKITKLKSLNIELLLPINTEIEYFKGKYIGQSIERNEVTIYLHTLYGGCLVERHRYFYIEVELFDKQQYDAEIDRRTYYKDPCQNFKKVPFENFKGYDSFTIGDINYYVDSDRIFFERYFQLDANTFVIATADFDKRMDKRVDYFNDIKGTIDILKSIQLTK